MAALPAFLPTLTPSIDNLGTCPSTIDGSTPACKPSDYDIWWPYPDMRGTSSKNRK